MEKTLICPYSSSHVRRGAIHGGSGCPCHIHSLDGTKNHPFVTPGLSFSVLICCMICEVQPVYSCLPPSPSGVKEARLVFCFRILQTGPTWKDRLLTGILYQWTGIPIESLVPNRKGYRMDTMATTCGSLSLIMIRPSTKWLPDPTQKGPTCWTTITPRSWMKMPRSPWQSLFTLPVVVFQSFSGCFT